jgi:hypothetical protein
MSWTQTLPGAPSEGLLSWRDFWLPWELTPDQAAEYEAALTIIVD